VKILIFKGHDFNKGNDELYVELCAMSNSLGGYIVLGIEEHKAPNGDIIKFVKNRFERGKKFEDDSSKFFPVIQIDNIEVA
jgi:predicted HTH transcriptional regulator